MRICIPIHSFEPGGVERVALRLAQRWQSAGEDVTVVLGRARGATAQQAPPLRYVTRREPAPTERWETPWLIWHLWRYLRRNDADVIFCAGNTYTVVCVAMKLLLGRRCPPVVAKISNDLVRRDMRPLVRAGYYKWLRIQGRMLDRFVAIAPPMAEEAIQALQIPPARIAMIANPILTEEQRSAPPRQGRAHSPGRHFVAVGRLEGQKRYILMLTAFRKIARANDRLSIAGEGSQRARIEAEIERAGLQSHVVLHGHLPDPTPLMREADALVMASDYEGLPGAVVEALAIGLPVAATDCCASMRWLLGDGAYGVLAATGDSDSLAAAMEAAALLSPDVARMHGFASLFTLEQSAPRYLALFQALCAGPAPVPSQDPNSAAIAGRDRNAAC